jgi:hypothetical protein
MILFLRDQYDKTILDVELFNTVEYESDGERNHYLELRSVVDIDGYTKLLMHNLYRPWEVSNAFSELQELRGWMWETYFNSANSNDGSDKNFKMILEILRTRLKDVAKKFDLRYVED